MTKVVIGMGYEKCASSVLRGLFSIPNYNSLSICINDSTSGVALYGSPFYFGKNKGREVILDTFSFLVDMDENEQQYESLAELSSGDINCALNQVINFCNNIRVRSNVSDRNLLETELVLITADEYRCLKKSLHERIKVILET